MNHCGSTLSAQVESWRKEEHAPFAGWDFSYLDGRMLEEQPPWSYSQRASELLQRADSALDMGTGGGEVLLDLRPHWPRFVIATEDYPPNVLLAAKRLSPDASVVAAHVDDNARLPFSNNSFDVILNRHSGFNAPELARMLKPAGRFFTQQVHRLWAADLITHFGAQPQWPDSTPEKHASALADSGLVVDKVQEWNGRLQFTDVGAVVYYLRAVPWLVPGFSVDTHLDALLKLQAKLDRHEPLVFLIRKYVIEAHRAPWAAQ